MIANLQYEISSTDVLTSLGRTYYVATHNLGTTNLLITLVSPSGDVMNGNDMFSLTDNQVVVEIPSQSFSGKYKLYIYYNTGSTGNFTKKKLFEQSLIDYDDIADYGDYRIAVGKAGTPTKNVTIDDFKAGLADSQTLPYLSDDPNDWDFTLTERMAAQYKLNVYDKAITDSMYSGAYPVTGVIDSVSAFTKNSGNISGTVTFNNVISPAGVSMYFKVPLTATEGTSGEIAVGTFTITGNSHYVLATDFTPYAQAMIADTNGILKGIGAARISSSLSSNVFTCTFYLSASAVSGAREAYVSLNFPVYVDQINS